MSRLPVVIWWLQPTQSPTVLAAVDVRHRPHHGPRQRRRTTGGPTRHGWSTANSPNCSAAPTSPWSASSAATAPGRTASTHWRPAALPTVVVSGEQTPDAELMGHSTTPAGVALQSHVYLAQGGVENLRQLHAFLCDTLLMTGFGFSPPATTPNWGVLEQGRRRMPRARPSRCCTTAHSTLPVTTATWRRCAGPSRTPAAGRCRCSARRCAQRTPRCSSCSAPQMRW